MSKSVLGRGLHSLIGDNDSPTASERMAYIDVDLLETNPHQPRQVFSEEALRELADSIKENGLLQPIVVTHKEGGGEGFTIVVGERRWRATQLLGLKKIPAIIREVSRKKLAGLALLENLQRQDLNPVEISESLHKMNKELNLNQEEIAKVLGMDRTSISNYIRLKNLSPESTKALLDEHITMGHAKVLLQVGNGEKERTLLSETLAKHLSVRDLEKRVQSLGRPARKKQEKELYLSSLEEELRSYVGLPVSITPKKRGGSITIRYKNEKEFEQIIQSLKE